MVLVSQGDGGKQGFSCRGKGEVPDAQAGDLWLGSPSWGPPGGPGSAGAESRAQRRPRSVSQPPLAAHGRAFRSVGPGQAIPSDCPSTGPASSNRPRRLGGPWAPQPSPRPGRSMRVLPAPAATRRQRPGPLPTSPDPPAVALAPPRLAGTTGWPADPCPFPGHALCPQAIGLRPSTRGTMCHGAARPTPRGGHCCPSHTALTAPQSGLPSPSPFWKVPESSRTLDRTLLSLPGHPTPSPSF